MMNRPLAHSGRCSLPARRCGGVAVGVLVLLTVACTNHLRSDAANSEVLFICEHGNVKSVMAASYFNAMARERRLPHRAAARGTAPDSESVPAPIAHALRADGFDVSDFRPAPVSQSDVRFAARIVTIGTQAPPKLDAGRVQIDQWNDVPPASVDYPAARDALQAHVARLIEELSATVQSH